MKYKSLLMLSSALSINACDKQPRDIDKPIEEDKDQPNIVVILADDLDARELGCYGGQNIKTPNIDRLASEGLSFTNHYASIAMSAPIRASLYTGLYPMRHGTYQNHKASNPNIKSVTHYLPQLGYRVGRAGKRDTQPANVYQFNEIEGFETNGISNTAHFNTNYIRSFMENKTSPFCLFVCSTHPHTPWTWGDPSKIDQNKIVLPPNFVDNAVTRERYRLYLAEIGALDVEVGAVLDALEKSGELDNTLILFLSEQGPQFPGAKWTLWNQGINAAMIARYPKKIGGGKITGAITQYEDILPTLIDFIGGDVVNELDGKSFLNVLFNNSNNHRNYAYGIHNNIPEGSVYPIRSIQNGRYKLIMNLLWETEYYEQHVMPGTGNSIWESWLNTAQNNQNAEFLVERYLNRPAIEFYDLQNDPWELDNKADDPAYSSMISTMQDELEKWMIQQGDTGISVDVP